MAFNLFWNFFRIVRFDNWWRYKIPLLIAIFFIAQLASPPLATAEVFYQLLLLLLWMIATASFGYFVNDWSDTEEDQKAGKQNFVAGLSFSVRVVIGFILAAISLGIQLRLNGIFSL